MQLTFEGKTIDQLAIELIQAYEPPEGYYLGFSGGKDSVVIYDLAKRSGVKYKPYYNVSPIDPPQIRDFLKSEYPEVIWENHAQGFWTKHFLSHGLPFRMSRWCCQIIKEAGHNSDVKILGMRKAESNKRSKYKCYTLNTEFKCKRDSKGGTLLPILNWQDSDVWQYISERQLKICSLYSEGFSRIGCILCPFAGKDEVKYSLDKFPKVVNLWKQASIRYYNERINNPKRKPFNSENFKSGEEYFNWWIKR